MECDLGATEQKYYVPFKPLQSVSNSVIDFDLKNVKSVLYPKRTSQSEVVTKRINKHYANSRTHVQRAFGATHEEDFQQYNWGLTLSIEMGLQSDQAELVMIMYTRDVEGRITLREFELILNVHTSFKRIRESSKKSKTRDLRASWRMYAIKKNNYPFTVSKKHFLLILSANDIVFDIDIERLSRDMNYFDYEADYLHQLLLDDPLLRDDVPPVRKPPTYKDLSTKILPKLKNNEDITDEFVDKYRKQYCFSDEIQDSNVDWKKDLEIQQKLKKLEKDQETFRLKRSESEIARREKDSIENSDLSEIVREIKSERHLANLAKFDAETALKKKQLLRSTSQIQSPKKSMYVPPIAKATNSDIEVNSEIATTIQKRQKLNKSLSMSVSSSSKLDALSTSSKSSYVLNKYRSFDHHNIHIVPEEDEAMNMDTESAVDDFEALLKEDSKHDPFERKNNGKEDANKSYPIEEISGSSYEKIPKRIESMSNILSIVEEDQHQLPSDICEVDRERQDNVPNDNSTNQEALSYIAQEDIHSTTITLSRRDIESEIPQNTFEGREIDSRENLASLSQPYDSMLLEDYASTMNNMDMKKSEQLQTTIVESVSLPKVLFASPRESSEPVKSSPRYFQINDTVNQPETFPNLDTLSHMPFYYYTFNVPKTNGHLRIHIRYDDDGEYHGLFIHSFRSYSKAEEQGLLKIGDELIEINGVSVEGGALEDIINVLSAHNGDSIDVTVRRYAVNFSRPRTPHVEEGNEHTDVSPRPFTVNADITQPEYFPDLHDLFELPCDYFTYDVPKTNGQLRIHIRYDDDGEYHGLFIHGFRPYSNAEEQGLLKVGDELIEINGVSVEGGTLNDVINALVDHDDEFVEITIRRRQRAAKYEEFFSPRMRSPRPLTDPNSTLLSSYVVDVPSSSNQLNTDKTYISPPSYEIDVLRVMVPKSEDGSLGCLVIHADGTSGSENGSGLYIHMCKPMSHASKLLRAGDEVLEINGVDLRGKYMKDLAEVMLKCSDIKEIPMVIARRYVKNS